MALEGERELLNDSMVSIEAVVTLIIGPLKILVKNMIKHWLERQLRQHWLFLQNFSNCYKRFVLETQRRMLM